MRKIMAGSILFIVLLSSCDKTKEEKRYEDVEKLYVQTCKLTKLYVDSMKHAKDSIALIELMERFDTRLSDLNFSVKAETDYKLDEGKNDTIYILIDSLRKIYDSRLYHLAHPVTSVDSIFSSEPASRS